jgi:hypothetical protein
LSIQHLRIRRSTKTDDIIRFVSTVPRELHHQPLMRSVSPPGARQPARTRSHPSFGLALDNARAAAAHPGPALEGIRLFFLATLRDHERFVLPLHGGPPLFTPATRKRQADIRSVLRTLLERGQAAGELRADLTPEDLIVAASLLSRPLPGTGDWERLARRQIDLMIYGLGP